MEVEIVSREYVKPCSPTSHHHKTYKLCLLDQFGPMTYFPVVYFYQLDRTILSHNSISQRSLLLKQSLSESLTRFYPFAGRLKDYLSVDCNDEGVYYVQAKANSPLSDYLTLPDLKSMHKLVPDHEGVIGQVATPGSILIAIQETSFLCGGISIGLIFSHVIFDGTALNVLLRDWAATSSKAGCKILQPNLGAESIFPQVDAFPMELNLTVARNPFLRTGRFIPRRFVFDRSSIEKLKAKATSGSSILENPTGVVVVTALLTKRIMVAFEATKSPGTRKPTLVSHPINLRKRANPKLPECLMGNILGWAFTLFRNEPDRLDLCGIVCQLREAMSKAMDSDFVRSLQGDRRFLSVQAAAKELMSLRSESNSNGADIVAFTSWCNFDLDGIDFGWGKPVWVSYCSRETKADDVPMLNFVVLMDTRVGKGMEAYVLLGEAEMALLEKDKELLEYALLDPSPLKLGAPVR